MITNKCRDCRRELARDEQGRLIDGDGRAVCPVSGGMHIRAHKQPEDLLAEVRYCVEQIKGFNSEDPGDSGELADFGRRLAEAVSALDAKLSLGAPMPRDWRS